LDRLYLSCIVISSAVCQMS